MRSNEVRSKIARATATAASASSRRVQPPERRKRRIVERLHAERHAIDPGRAKAAKALRLDAGRVGFERDLDVGGDRPVSCDGVEDRADGRGLHQRGRAAAEEDGRDGAARHAVGGRGDLRGKGAREAGLVDGGVAHMAVEVAIRALRQAERPVDIDPEGGLIRGGQRCPRHASASLGNARARCDRPLPSAAGRASPRADISPKVRAWPSGRNIGS